MPIKTVIFDLDGTITRPFLDFDAIRSEIGLSRDCTSILHAMEQMSPHDRARADQILARHETLAVENSQLNDGAARLIDQLRSQGIKIGVLTRNIQTNVWAVAKKHGLHFDAIIDRDSGPVKPDGFGVRRLCEEFGCDPSEAVVVGDYVDDLLAAKAANSTAILIKNHKKAAEFGKNADFTINSLQEIPNIIENINRERTS